MSSFLFQNHIYLFFFASTSLFLNILTIALPASFSNRIKPVCLPNFQTKDYQSWMNVISTSQVTGYGFGTQKPLTNEYEYLFKEFPEQDVVKIEQEFKKGEELSQEECEGYPYF